MSIDDCPRRSVPRVAFESMQQLRDVSAPVLLSGSPAEHWPALNWTVEAMIARSTLPKPWWASRTPLIKYHDTSQPLTDGLDAESWQPPFREVNMTLQTFVSLCRRRSADAAVAAAAGEHYYFTGEARTKDNSVIADVTPWESFALPESGEDDTRVNTWVSCAGVTMHAHYDLAHNTFVHLLGRKRFYLLPPAHTTALYIAPKGHPQFRSSLIANLHEVSLRRFPLFASVDQVWLVDLAPGDVLYVPPGWIHLVKAVRNVHADEPLSVSVNIFSNTAELGAYQRLEERPVPFEEAWPLATRLAAVPALMIFLLRFIAHGNGEVTATDDCHALFLRQWAASRWAPLAGGVRRAEMTDCATDQPVLTTEHFRERARAIAEDFVGMRPQALREVLVQNYFDTVVSFTMEWNATRAAQLSMDVAERCFTTAQ